MDVIFNMYKIRYTDLSKLLYGYPGGSVQLFINLEPVLRRLYRSDIESYLKANRQKRVYEFVSNVLNLAAHYRKFLSNQGRSTEIVLYMPDNKNGYVNGMLIKGYRHENDARLFDIKTVYGRFLQDTAELISTIITYIEGVHLVRSNTIEPSLIPMVISNSMPNKIIVTTDRYDYQYAHHGYTILRPRKNSESYCITKANVIDTMKAEDKILSDETMSSSFIPLALSFMGDHVRGIPKVKGIGLYRIMKLVEKGIAEGLITENTTNLSLMENLLVDDIKEHVRNNFMVIDLQTQMFNVSKSTAMVLRDQMEDKFDNVSLKKLNQLFIESPIMLNELMPMKERKSVFES